MEYVAGFMFNIEKTRVALIRKINPEWQRGYLNGIGGKVEEGEMYIDAMCREFQEETGLKTFYYDWKELITLTNVNPNWKVHFYHAKTNYLDQLKSTTDEEITIIDISNLDNEKVIHNLHWLIRMCFDDEVSGGEVLNHAKEKK